MRFNLDFYNKATVCSAITSCIALSVVCDTIAIVNAGRDIDFDFSCLFSYADTFASGAWLFGNFALALTMRTYG